MSATRLSRRKLLGVTAGAAAFTIVPRHVLGGANFVAPSETITHGIIGVGGMGTGHIGYVLGDKQAKLLAVCDVDGKHLENAVKKGGEGTAGYTDFRDMLDRDDVDVVHIATPPHWHALMSIAAAEAGCDVWCEKPLSRTIGEGKHVVAAVQRNGRM